MTTDDDRPGHLLLVRHGATEWSRTGRHTGQTDLDLLPVGERAARALGPVLAAYRVVRVLSSPLQRAWRTAELAGTRPERDDRLVEWDYGGYEGLTTAEIVERTGRPWNVFAQGVVPGDTPGETIEQVAARAAAVLQDVRADLTRGDVCLFAHGHLLRVLTAGYLELAPDFGGRLLLDAGALCVLGHDRSRPAIRRWNLVPDDAVGPTDR